MRKIGSTIATMFSIVALGSCTAIGCYEFYNSYLTTAPKNIVSYHQAANAGNTDDLATMGNATEDIATFSNATASDAVCEDLNNEADKK